MTGAPNGMLTRREASELAHVHLNTVRLWEQAERVTTERAESGVVLIPRSDVERVIEQRRKNAPAGERIAALEVEARMLREDLERVRAERDDLLAAVLSVAERAS